ncbi:A-kinase anchor protein 10, mitochondrial [Spodoptera litura]|uniref:A-kinase anchor protein 10, mitochondrial n=1 Tax=Spodoptera litura TaxID=69820 RepID=A0A9J7DVZ8_SPOLT|nr:A-kinase anchor protein 10, mitochondrial [Spodoptera litura]
MIKFWKSAAKGKTGCPVRPPEVKSVSTPDIKSLINTQILLEENEDPKQMFEKSSKLSLSVNDIIFEKKALKYFIQYMESIGKPALIKCLLEIEEFRKHLLNSTNTTETGNLSKINRTQSLDLPYKHEWKQDKDIKSQKCNWRENNDVFTMTSNARFNECSMSSCSNLSEHDTSAHSKSSSDNKQLQWDYTEEAVAIFKKYVALEAPYQLDLPDSYRKSVISNICQPEGQIQENCFKPVQEVLISQIENNHYNDFINSPFYIKAQIDILTSGSLNLKDILHNETILFYFTEFLEQESCRVLLEFLMAVMHFRDNLLNGCTTSSDQAQADAISIYEKYFSLQATHPIGFPTETRLRIESDICREGGPLPTCFDLPYQIVFKTLTQYVKTFLESELYFKYLSEMIHSVDNMWSSHHKSHSDCSSEFSISTQNTLLAMGDPVFRKKKRNLSVPDMTIDSNQLYNADALWQRNRPDGLNLGRVNSLGRFESKFEPDPDKKDKSVLKKMVSRFVPSNTSKVEEEMAWQIAHMIVKDITDLTMAPPDNEHDDM